VKRKVYSPSIYPVRGKKEGEKKVDDEFSKRYTLKTGKKEGGKGKGTIPRQK